MERREVLRLLGLGVVVGGAGLLEACQQTPPPAPKPEAAPATTAPAVISTLRPLANPTAEIPRNSEPAKPPTPLALTELQAVTQQINEPTYQAHLDTLGYGLKVYDRRDEQSNPRSGIISKPVVFYQYPPLWPDYGSIPSTWRMSPTLFPSPRDEVRVSWPTELTLKDLNTGQDLAVLIENTGNLMNSVGSVTRYAIMVWYPNDVRIKPDN